jgi:hypothetical protein
MGDPSEQIAIPADMAAQAEWDRSRNPRGNMVAADAVAR